ncbi:AAA family ATPase [Dactylosporangium sp. CA-139066]|uniref:AAA family ATPase n=1 Tax=Dactylosporangium sp. CA-139066 TaxID=3239930 RepID=UPI003D8D44D0
MTLATDPPPLAWYGGSFAYYDEEPEPPTDAERDAAAEQARARRTAGFTPEQFGDEPGGAERAGLVLGRFLPVHDGHRYLIEFARAWAGRVFVFVRVQQDDPIPWEVRRDWLRELFPDVSVHAVEDGPRIDEGRWAERILAEVHPDYVFSGEGWGYVLARRLGARYVCVDREHVPVTGTQVRADPWAYERYLPPPVRAWYTRRVCLIGAESTGKTTLARRLAEHYGTTWAPERLRSYSVCADDPADVADAAFGQRAAEDLLARRASRVLLCDTDVLSMRLWCERLFGAAPQWLVDAAERPAADLHLLMAPDLPFAGADELNRPGERREFHAACERELKRLGRPFVTIEGSFDERFERAVAAVDELLGR